MKQAYLLCQSNMVQKIGEAVENLDTDADLATTVAKVNELLTSLRNAGIIET